MPSSHLSPVQGKNYPHYVKPPTKPSTPPWLPSKHPGDTLYGPGIRAYKRHPRHMARGSGAQRGQGGPKGHTANLQSNAWGAHMVPPWHFHQEKLSSRRRCSKGTAARAQVPRAASCLLLRLLFIVSTVGSASCKAEPRSLQGA